MSCHVHCSLLFTTTVSCLQLFRHERLILRTILLTNQNKMINFLNKKCDKSEKCTTKYDDYSRTNIVKKNQNIHWPHSTSKDFNKQQSNKFLAKSIKEVCQKFLKVNSCLICSNLSVASNWKKHKMLSNRF